MYYIFASSKKVDLTPIKNMNKESISWCVPKDFEISEEYHYNLKGNRIFDCYSFTEGIKKNVDENHDQLHFFHGYLLRKEGIDDILRIDPEKNYYGVYSHGKITHESCYFATDEIGLSPLYYSSENGIVFVSNNPHLIAIYKRKLGFEIKVEPTLAVWHTIGITNESNNTGYAGIYRVKPWRYIFVDVEDNILFPTKERLGKDNSYEDLVYESIKELRNGMETINEIFENKHSQLTGGFDSRLVMAYIIDNGNCSDWDFTTKGTMKNPDCIVADMLGKQFGLNYKIEPRKHFKEKVDDIDGYVKDICMANAMESSLVRLNNFQGMRTNEVCLNGMGAVFAKSLDFASSFKIFMQRKFRGQNIDFDNLTDEQYNQGYDCFGHADVDRFFLKESGLDVVKEFRKYLFKFNYNRFQDNMNYADAMSAYRWRIHNCNLATMENNLIFLYSPIVLEASRKLDYHLRNEGKLYFDMMWRLNPELCFIPFENRVYNPDLYKEFPNEIKNIFKNIPPVTGDITSESQITFFDTILPIMKDTLVDSLPSEIFDYINKDSVIERLNNNDGFGKPVFALMGLYGISKWYEIVKDLNEKI
ncbi:hypothetical protein [Anaerofustis butyriciformans]|uniref:hypothetical protein n=1 Tax=Anaerofustis butyriciformans TaxID=3108533 RepID=UPI002E35D29C|nr:hypothetical protein [Anaerofustis sp. HA2171]